MTQPALLPEPVPPEDWECCGSGCGEACVWEIYYREKAAYDAQQRTLSARAGATEVDKTS